MSRNVFAFIICCFLCLLSFLAFDYKSVETSWFFVSNVKAMVVASVRKFEILPGLQKVDVFKLCEKICDRQMKSCVDPAISVLVYNDTLPQNMTFRQNFNSFVPNVEVREANKEKVMEKWKHKRKLCPVDDLDPKFRTITKQAKCAIIGNSGILLGSKCGKTIDAHDFVLRANLAKLNGYTDDVGHKTSVMMINVAIVRKLYKILTGSSKGSVKEKVNMLRYFQSIQGATMWYPKATGRDTAKHLQEIATVLIKEKVSLHFGFSTTSAAGVSARKWKMNKTPSTGLIALTAAQSFCKNITLFGFYPYQKDSSGARVLHHYYEPNRTSFHTDVHNFDEEFKLLGNLHDKQVLRRVVGPCKVSGIAQLHQIPSLNRAQTETSGKLDKNQTKTLMQNQLLLEKLPWDHTQTETNVQNQRHDEKLPQHQVPTEILPLNQRPIEEAPREQNQTDTVPRNQSQIEANKEQLLSPDDGT